ncbi:HbrB-like-domain-containing protein [Catenaria anguillulae PL171]|uniref:HbrB-like-domain-containing protein n=1 Tax=Catenaria anguillulae PL171 TaxID=765915 RepID=A0A1Y2HPV7_9FUNG|nr:HbrB-like-domain-containing protein [Catenaria anguillulae PL171]
MNENWVNINSSLSNHLILFHHVAEQMGRVKDGRKALGLDKLDPPAVHASDDGTTSSDPQLQLTSPTTTAGTASSSATAAPPPTGGHTATAAVNNAHLTSVIAPFLNPRLSTSSSIAGLAPPLPGGPPASAPSPTSPRSPTFQQQHHLFDSASDGVGDQVWDTIESRVLPLFVGEGLNSTVEEINFLLSRYLAQQLYGTILEELKDLLREGVHRLMAKFLTPDVVFPDPLVSIGMPSLAAPAVPASQSKYLIRWTEIWTFYFSVVLPYLQSVFLPLQAEIKGSRLVNSVRTLVLLAFRDRAVLPHIDSIQVLVGALAAEFSPTTTSTHRAGVRISTLSISSLTPAAQQEPSATATPMAEARIAQLQQMLLVLGDLPWAGRQQARRQRAQRMVKSSRSRPCRCRCGQWWLGSGRRLLQQEVSGGCKWWGVS